MADTATLPRPYKKVLLALAVHGELTAREVSLDVWRPEHHVRRDLARLEERGLVTRREADGRIANRLTAAGRAMAAQLSQERVGRAEHEAHLAAAADVAVCPTCQGERRYCATCWGTRLVAKEGTA